LHSLDVEGSRYVAKLPGKLETSMLTNRSVPRCTVIPELAYPDVGEATTWLCDVFGFNVRIRIGNHRTQLNVGEGAIVVKEQAGGADNSSETEAISSRRVDVAHSVMVRVDDVDGHHERVKQRGVHILREPADYPYGERQYSVEDFAGHRWTFTQSIADVAPEQWGGTPGKLF
jgi:uncharacterized glyoxalase superfamily protein PhnB